MNKRTFLMFAASMQMLFCAFGEIVTVDGVGWNYRVLNETEKTITITTGNRPSGDVVVPDSINGYRVVSIGNSAFYYATNLTSVVIQDGVTNIGWKAFFECKNLIRISIPNTVKSIDSRAFFNCIKPKFGSRGFRYCRIANEPVAFPVTGFVRSET